MNSLFYYARLVDNATNTGYAKKSGTFRGWQEKAIKAREALKKVRQDYNDDLQEIIRTYSPNVAAQKKAELDERFNSIVSDAKDKLKDALEEVIESKQRWFDKCSGAPSAEDLRLLQALSMRSNMSIAEVASAAGKLNQNVQSMGVLRDIAAKFDIHIPIGAATPEEFDSMVQRAREFSLDRLRELETPDKEMSYKAKMFFDYADLPGETAHFYGPLDNNVLTTEQISTATKQAQQAAAKPTEPQIAAGETSEGDAVPMWAEVTASGNQNISTIAAQFHVSTQQIREANPDKDLDRIYTGDKILVPSTRFAFQPDPSGGHVQPDQVRAVPAPQYSIAAGPSGETIGEDITVI